MFINIYKLKYLQEKNVILVTHPLPIGVQIDIKNGGSYSHNCLPLQSRSVEAKKMQDKSYLMNRLN